MSTTELDELKQAQDERLSDCQGFQLLGDKLPEEDYPALTAQNVAQNIAAFMVAPKILEILDIQKQEVVDRGERRNMVNKYKLDFLDVVDDATIDTIHVAYSRAKSKVSAA